MYHIRVSDVVTLVQCKDVFSTLRHLQKMCIHIAASFLKCSPFPRAYLLLSDTALSKAPSASSSILGSSLLFRCCVAFTSFSSRPRLHILKESCTFNMSLLNNSNENLTLDCPIYTEDSKYWMEFINFWVGGVVQTLSIIFGFVGKFVINEHKTKLNFPLLF